MAIDYLEKAVSVVPTKRQIEYMNTEFNGIINFGMNTFTSRDEGTGFEEPDLFNPTAFSAEQWVKVAKRTGMTGLVLNCKHHEGFCLWPTEQTDYSVKSSCWLNGEGDVVRAVSDACRKYDLKFGIALSPLDYHEPSFGMGNEYNIFFKNLLRELLTNYGEIFCVSLDGATDNRKNGKKQAYDWEGYFKLIRELQPDAAITNCGPDIRWCGNNSGICRISEWSVVPAYYKAFDIDSDKKISVSGGKVDFTQTDIASRRKIKRCDEFTWYPAEVTMPLRETWFYKKGGVLSIKPLSKLQKVYDGSVGGNGSMLLGIAPQPDGLIGEKDIETLATFGAILSLHFDDNLALESTMQGSCKLDDLHSPTRALPDKTGYWHSGNNPEDAELILDMGDEYDVDRVVLSENIETGQQIEKFALYVEKDGKWKKVESGTVIGRKRICEMKVSIRTRRIKLVILKTRKFATIKEFSVY
ncbi:MAG: alpha-L-fucosidase [Clostridia bacterium]|nr:alpha-L-fucosidase [Clostridia bacterium]